MQGIAGNSSQLDLFYTCTELPVRSGDRNVPKKRLVIVECVNCNHYDTMAGAKVHREETKL